MSHGLGKLQQRILNYLETAGRWQTAQQVIAGVVDSSQLEPSRSLEVSVRRAAQGLKRRGMTDLGSVSLRPHQQTAYWLPHQAPPDCLNRRVWHS